VSWNRLRWSLYAPVYDTFISFDRPRRRSLAVLDPAPGEHVLIAGCGTGMDIPLLPAGLRLAAIDISPAMARRAAEKACAYSGTAGVAVMDGERLAFPDACFDAVVLHLILALIPDPAACLGEVERVLKPGGRAVVFDKFLQPGRVPSLLRRVSSAVVAVFFTEVNRSLEQIVAATGLAKVHDEPAMAGDLFRIALLRKMKPPAGESAPP
jgi:ubiquinone/menaquinone biosynthesis C-methylase UbiE